MYCHHSIRFIWSVLFVLTFFHSSTSCWGPGSNEYGETTPDYDLYVGSELVIDCSLKSETPKNIKVPVNSTYLKFKRVRDNQIFQNYTHVIDGLTSQLKIPNADVNDSGIYHCQIVLPDNSSHLVCSTKVYVGFPPQNVSNFKCISRNFDNLTCTWDIEPNNIRTNYSVQKIFVFQNYFQSCPKPNNTYCQWRADTEPPYEILSKNLTFVVHGNNSLGTIENEFKFDHFAIVIPNSPEELNPIDVGKQSFTIQWMPPKMPRIVDKPLLFYQLRLEEIERNLKDAIVIDVGVERYNFTFDNLIPNFKYNVSVRCRSNHTMEENMWSTIASIMVKTYPDVPYVLPEVNTEAFLIHNFGNYRNATLYWKPVSKRFFNGENFHYHVECFQSELSGKTYIGYVTSSAPFVKIGHLKNDSSYSFHIYSANKEGVSDDYRSIFIDERNKIAPAPKDIRAISHELGFYNLTWSNTYLKEVNFTVFWCAGRKPSNCDEPIQWSDGILKDPTFALEVVNASSSFQFAVAASYKDQSSGMQWASCIVPSKAPLGQIPITHIEPSSTTLRVIWKLDCEAQKSVIDRYVITYCREGRNCEDAVAKPDVQSYTLENLHPFSNYSVKLRAFNKENKPSEDVDEMYQTTLSAGPADAPHNVTIISETDSTVQVKWLPPLEPNGVITHYNIYHNEFMDEMKDESSCKSCSFLIENLKQFTQYDISIEACTGLFCSKKSLPIIVLTDVGVPGRMDPPRIENVNETHIKVSWNMPSNPNGPIDFFDIQWQQEVGNETSNLTVSHNESLSVLIEFKCSNLLDGRNSYLFYIRAINEKNGNLLYGPFSSSTKGTACIMSQGLAMIIGIAIGGTLALAIFLLVIYKLIKWMSEKIHQVKNIAVRLPKELEGPETNPLNNYENFKKGLVQSIHNGKIDHQSYAIDESDNKNRHGSGSSQFSNASTDELIFKNGKCTKFGRKPSGDSSGCSSMSSNTTTRMHLSSDSGTESDFMVPASPDSLTTDQTILNGHKSPMPILMEIRDSSEASCETQAKTPVNIKCDKHNIFNNGMVLKVDHAYSKFGISGNLTSSIPCPINPLAFYSCNLANSEPSVFEAQNTDKQKPSMMPPYSKIGLAKSSVDIPGIISGNKELGYSKFGYGAPQYCFSIDVENLNPIVGVALVENTLPNVLSRADTGLENENYFGKSDDGTVFPSFSMDYRTADSCQLKTNIDTFSSKKPSSGYVSVGDMRSIKRIDNLSISESSIDEENSPLQSPEDLSIDLSFVSSDWKNNILCPSESRINDVSFLNPDSFNKPLISQLADNVLSPNFGLSLTNGCVQIMPSKESVSSDNDPCTKMDDLSSNIEDNHLISSSFPFSETETSSCPTHSSTPVSEGEHNSEKKPQLPEVVLAPAIGRNGYVPFSTLSSVCDLPVSTVPNATESNVPLSVFPDDICTDIDQNYITPSNKSNLKLLQEGLVTKNKNFSPLLHCNGKKMHKISKPLKYILKPLPKMESEICEV
ncbi:phosphatidylinositol phosphatase PTPRQ [Nephila pilipes]|uniref:Phosphatidylinositol phosphatase PTPRQ n=1 Tax=Nephila pilipes TaxID=299642 RepID=A0A8X6NU53_NEPPI|nr:phosphatidylinositol phosphatase PTPRQ [Nephila pilipes]